MKLEFSRYVFSGNVDEYQISWKIRPVGAGSFNVAGRTDREARTKKLTVAFHDFVNESGSAKTSPITGYHVTSED